MVVTNAGNADPSDRIGRPVNARDLSMTIATASTANHVAARILDVGLQSLFKLVLKFFRPETRGKASLAVQYFYSSSSKFVDSKTHLGAVQRLASLPAALAEHVCAATVGTGFESCIADAVAGRGGCCGSNARRAASGSVRASPSLAVLLSVSVTNVS